jgi:XTP/dITP diphosphohydrolase
MKKVSTATKINRFLLKMMGYNIDVVNIPPEAKKCVILFAPHSSMLDFIVGKMALVAMGVKTYFLIKQEAFIFPLNYLLKALGGVPVDRKNVKKFPLLAANLIKNSEEIAFLVAPEGTRKCTNNWKKGFYFIAQQAEVPVILGYLDYRSRKGGLGHIFPLSGDINADLAQIQRYYYGMRGRYRGYFNFEDKPYSQPQWLTKKQMRKLNEKHPQPQILVFATHNIHKREEVQEIVGNRYFIKSLQDVGYFEEVEETGDTLQANALQKARFVYQHFGCDCFADDTGLEVEALGGAPGVYSARFAGEGCSYADNVHKLLREMEGVENRNACFRTVIALILDGKEHLFEGRIEGKIITALQGKNGFGYDPIFMPENKNCTFAEMEDYEKNQISHRGRAMQEMMRLLRIKN